MPKRILVVDDEQSMRDFLSIFLKKEGYAVECASDGLEAIGRLKKSPFNLIISDVKMSNMNGMELLSRVKRDFKETEFIVMTAFSSTLDAITAMRDGAYDYITKPFKLDEIKITIRKALEKQSLASENTELKKQIDHRKKISTIIANSAPMLDIFDMIHKIADTKATVLVTGESGTGKELVARAIHFNSNRADNPFVTVNCGAIPSELMESELFGHVKGSFTGAVRDKEGLFATASDGTLFLDEVSELPLVLQVKLLRALQERKIMQVGGVEETIVDTRLIAATNRDLAQMVNEGRFREDLYYRLNVIQIKVPPLRKRKEDIPLLAHHFIKRSCSEMGHEAMSLSEAALMILQSYHYPGNVRELANIIERAVALEATDQIRPESLPTSMLRAVADIREPMESESASASTISVGAGFDLDKHLEAIESELILSALEEASGVKTEAARLLGISFRSLRYRLKKLGLETDSGEKEE